MTWARIGELVSVTGGGTPRRSESRYYNGDIPWVTPKDMKRHQIGSSEVAISEDGVANSPAKLVDAGSTLVVVRSGVLKHTLPVAITTRAVTVNQDMKALTPRSGQVDPNYLARLVKAQEPRVLRSVRATTADNFPIDDLLNIEIPVPPLPEQRRIAAILDEADALRGRKRHELTSLAELTERTYDAVFGDIRQALRQFPVQPLRSVAQARLGRMLDKKRETGVFAKPYLRNTNVQWFRFELNDILMMDFPPAIQAAYRLRDGDLMVCEGGQPGRCAVWRGGSTEMYFQKALHRVRPDTNVLLPDFLAHTLKKLNDSGLLADSISVATISHLTGEKLNEVGIPVPPLAQQSFFVSLLGEAAAIAARVEESARAGDELFASLQHRAFRGEL